ncbi:hypothetical protein L6452_06266 [Arctium lappa]|uniref:Uncharacterized protein n=1 Tax=Arctium lappa TaxID=4217 RepID=A0ACB9EIY3_ARCLA|nr:hypothetical protein L6452_06266 [Arctium lappa]
MLEDVLPLLMIRGSDHLETSFADISIISYSIDFLNSKRSFFSTSSEEVCYSGGLVVEAVGCAFETILFKSPVNALKSTVEIDRVGS